MERGNEVEAKYLVCPGVAQKSARQIVACALRKQGFRLTHIDRVEISDTYFDTANGALFDAGLTARIRRLGKQPTATIKSLPSADALWHKSATFDRIELEQTLKTKQRHKLPTSGIIGDLLQETLGEQNADHKILRQITHRERFLVSDNKYAHHMIEMSIDKVRTKTKPRLSYIEIEFELLRGDNSLLDKIHRELASTDKIYPAKMSKLQRGRGPPKNLTFDQQLSSSSWTETIAAELGKALVWLNQTLPYAWEAIDPEGVHQARIAIRKLQARLTLLDRTMGTKLHEGLPGNLTFDLGQAIRGLMKTLGQARDLDVHVHQLPTKRTKSLRHYKSHLHNQRCDLQIELRDNLDRFHQVTFPLIIKLEKHLATPDRANSQATSHAQNAADSDHLEKAIEPALFDVIVATHAAVKRKKPRLIHKARIRIKRLRYQIECLQKFGISFATIHSQLTTMQAQLGSYQDARIALRHLNNYLHGAPTHELPQLQVIQHRYKQNAAASLGLAINSWTTLKPELESWLSHHQQ